MNMKQARSLIRSLSRYSKKRCGYCGKKYQWTIVEMTCDGWKREEVHRKCDCSTTKFTKFDH